MNTVWLAFITGLTTGGISCLAVQGGLLASAVSNPAETSALDAVSRKDRLRGIVLFVAAKMLAHMIFGAFLGFAGSTLLLSPKALGVMQIAVGMFMLGTAGRILNIHPIFRYVAIQPPKGIYKFLRVTSKSGRWFAPLLLGCLTILMPCGVTQVMMVAAVGTGNPLVGALTMGAFVVGTSPLFFLLGAAVTEMLQKKLFAYLAAGAVAVFGIVSINGGLGLFGSFYTLDNIWKAATTDVSALVNTGGAVAGINDQGQQEARVVVTTRGYETTTPTLKVGVPVKLTVSSKDAQGCARAFTIPEFNISKILPENGETEIVFTPTKTGRLAYSCSMGMYTGQFRVIK